MRTVLALLLTAQAAAPPRPADRAAEVLAFEREVCSAYERNDALAINRLVADDYTLTDSFGHITTKADDLKAARAKDVQYTVFRNEDMRIRFYGDTAIVTGKTVVRGAARDGTLVDVLVQFTDTVVKIGGRWRLVAGHVSRLPRS